jgi:hypothetical protein
MTFAEPSTGIGKVAPIGEASMAKAEAGLRSPGGSGNHSESERIPAVPSSRVKQAGAEPEEEEGFPRPKKELYSYQQFLALQSGEQLKGPWLE